MSFYALVQCEGMNCGDDVWAETTTEVHKKAEAAGWRLTDEVTLCPRCVSEPWRHPHGQTN